MPIISLRKIYNTDKKYFAKWWRDIELLKLTSGVLDNISDEDINKYFQNILTNKKDFHYIITLDKIAIGHVSLNKRKNNWYETQIIIGEKNQQGKGYGTKAIKLLLKKAKLLGILKIYLEVRPDNARAIQTYKKCGFVETRHIKNSSNKKLLNLLRMELSTD